MKIFVCILPLFFSCSTVRKDNSPQPITTISDELKSEIERIKPLLLMCDNEPVPTGNNAVTGRVNCNSGDAMLWAGLYYSSVPSPEIAQAIKDSFGDDGQPFRSPEHKLGKDSIDAFSRDQTLGFLSYCLKSKDFETCDKFYQYAQNHEYNTCPISSDTRCKLQPSTLYVLGTVWAANNWKVPAIADPSKPERAADELILQEEAVGNKNGFRLHLVSLSLWLRGSTGNLTSNYKKAIGTLHKREPNNLWYTYLDTIYNDGTTSLDDITTNLLTLMKSWPGTSLDHWSWEEQNRYSEASGHDYVFLAKKLLGE